MSSSSFMSCPRRSDRGTTGRIRKFSAVLNIKQAETRRLNKQANVEFVPALWLLLPASVVCTEVLNQSRLGARPCSISGSLPKPPLFITTESSNCISTIICRFQRSTTLLELNIKWERSRWARMEQDDLFQYQKQGNRKAPSLPKVVPCYTLMYAHTNIHSHTLRRDHMHLQIVIRGQNMMVIFSQLLLWECPSFVFYGGEHRNKSLEKKNMNNKKKTLRSEAHKKIYMVFSKKAEVKSSPNPKNS